jgi:hypothetical protein
MHSSRLSFWVYNHWTMEHRERDWLSDWQQLIHDTVAAYAFVSFRMIRRHRCNWWEHSQPVFANGNLDDGVRVQGICRWPSTVATGIYSPNGIFSAEFSIQYFHFSCQFSLNELLHIHQSRCHRHCTVLMLGASLNETRNISMTVWYAVSFSFLERAWVLKVKISAGLWTPEM